MKDCLLNVEQELQVSCHTKELQLIVSFIKYLRQLSHFGQKLIQNI